MTVLGLDPHNLRHDFSPEWLRFRNGLAQKFLRAWLEMKIAEARTKLEKTEAGDLTKIQGEILTLRSVLRLVSHHVEDAEVKQVIMFTEEK